MKEWCLFALSILGVAFCAFMLGRTTAPKEWLPAGHHAEGTWQCTELAEWPMWEFDCPDGRVLYQKNPETICCNRPLGPWRSP